ncbi:NAD(P)/FAD-dependent oxidoreductase [Streptomyces sp. NPDC090798]|uniref:NAD(P)/FAD-dependent oxidoreductase n=1 Tax=Streptomyces sp. NPDC090798 TaxID=3365968 RepID=UPI00380A1F58
MTLPSIVIVGASAAGLSAAESLRNRGYDGALTLIGDEPHIPYDRPPLSKQVLSGVWPPERVFLRDQNALAALGLTLMLNHTAVALDMTGRQVVLADGERIGFDGLVIATGAAPRRLARSAPAGVHVLRTLDDALALRTQLVAQPEVVVVGAGFLGSEVAATARTMGLKVTLVDPLPVPLHQQLGDRIGALIAQLHADHGTSLRCGRGVRRLLDAEGRVVGVELTDGSVLHADVVVVAIGAAPTVGWLAGSGLSLGNGVDCDAKCRAAPGIYAVGDVAGWPNQHFGTKMRLEHRLNATQQAVTVAGNLLGDDQPYTPVPYFWTDQYDARIQVHGIIPPGADVTVLQGDPADRRFVAAYGHHGVVVGVLGWNSPRALRSARALVVGHAPWPPHPYEAAVAAADGHMAASS